jgi:HupE/UreJ protein
MKTFRQLLIFTTLALAAFFAACRPAFAHPVPFSYVDARMRFDAVELTIVAHVFDVAHDLGVDPPERLLEAGTLAAQNDAIIAMVRNRLKLSADGAALTDSSWSKVEPLAERQSVRIRARFPTIRTAGSIAIDTVMFPYDPQHQTFVNFYERDAVSLQSILDRSHSRAEFFAGTGQGVRAVLRTFAPAGINHILVGPDHLLFLLGLMLLGGSLVRLAVIVTAFTIGHTITLALATMSSVSPPAGLIEPAIALTVVYLGADNLLVRGGRDVRMWIALAFGVIHGFGFANVLRGMDLPGRALGWTLFGFNTGVELGQLLVVVIGASALAWIRSQSESAGRRLVFAGSIAVMAAGAFWFVQRVFFPGGIV